MLLWLHLIQLISGYRLIIITVSEVKVILPNLNTSVVGSGFCLLVNLAEDHQAHHSHHGHQEEEKTHFRIRTMKSSPIHDLK